MIPALFVFPRMHASNEMKIKYFFSTFSKGNMRALFFFLVYSIRSWGKLMKNNLFASEAHLKFNFQFQYDFHASRNHATHARTPTP